MFQNLPILLFGIFFCSPSYYSQNYAQSSDYSPNYAHILCCNNKCGSSFRNLDSGLAVSKQVASIKICFDNFIHIIIMIPVYMYFQVCIPPTAINSRPKAYLKNLPVISLILSSSSNNTYCCFIPIQYNISYYSSSSCR